MVWFPCKLPNDAMHVAGVGGWIRVTEIEVKMGKKGGGWVIVSNSKISQT